MLKRQREEIEAMTPTQIRELADRLEVEISGRGLMVQVAAAGTVRELRRIADRKAQHQGGGRGHE